MGNTELTNDQRQILGLRVAELKQLHKQLRTIQNEIRRQENLISQMCVLIKPEMGSEGSGWSFDMDKLSFVYKEPDGVGNCEQRNNE